MFLAEGAQHLKEMVFAVGRTGLLRVLMRCFVVQVRYDVPRYRKQVAMCATQSAALARKEKAKYVPFLVRKNV